VLGVVAVVVLPFAVLLRASTWLYLGRGWATWGALGMGVALTLLVLTLYGALLARRFTGRFRVGLVARWVALPAVLAYCGYSLLYLSSANAKTEAVRETYTSLHPILRLAVSTLVLVDGDLVITDAARQPEDYEAMGLPVREWSLHYHQQDGYVHAIDLRTAGRSEARNFLTQAYFRLLGFRTLRHVGTADHLHVSLPLKPPGPGIPPRGL
jgi:hypothetical protein